MKFAAFLLAFPLAGCGAINYAALGHGAGSGVTGTGKPVMQTRIAKAVTSVEVMGAMDVQIRHGAPKLVIEAQKEILKLIRTEYKGGVLKIFLEGNASTSEPIRAYYTGPSVSGINGGGATTWDVTGLTGAKSNIELSGASHAKVEGKVTNLTVQADGASEANLKGLKADNATLEANGASKIYATAKNSIKASANGASEIRYFGKVGKVTQDTSGASTVGPAK